jgi:hypothetical protein
MDIDALRQAHEKLKRKSLKQRDRIKELEEGLEGLIKFSEDEKQEGMVGYNSGLIIMSLAVSRQFPAYSL